MMTTISGLLLHADGEPANGQAVISWIAFQIHEVVIVGGQKMVEIVDGQFTVQLYPNITAHPKGAYYTVRMELQNGSVYEEYWVVPDMPTASVEQVRSSFPLEPGMLINPMQIAGSGAEAGMILAYNGSYWVPGYVTVENVSPNWIQLDVGSAGDDFWIDGNPVQLGRIATINIPSASLTARGLVTTGDQSFAGNKTFANRVGAGGAAPQYSLDAAGDANVSGVYRVNGVPISAAGLGGVPATRQVIAGAGLGGGGSLAADVTLTANVLSVNGLTGAVVLTPASLGVVQGHAIQDEGVVRAVRAALNFVGDGVSVTDDAANNRSQVLITGGASGSQTPWLSHIDGNTFELRNVGGIGVGTSTPQGNLEVASQDPFTPAHRGAVISQYWGGSHSACLWQIKGRGTLAAPAPVLAGDSLGHILHMGVTTGGTKVVGAFIQSVVTAVGTGTLASDFIFSTNPGAAGAVERMRITAAGFVGIGQANPLCELFVATTNVVSGNRGIFSAQYSDTVHSPIFNMVKYRGTVAAPATLVAGDYVGAIGFMGYTGTQLVAGAFIYGLTSSVAASAISTHMLFGTSGAERMRITDTGNVVIGATAASNKLAVVDGVVDATGSDAALANTIRRGLMVQGAFGSYDGGCIQMGAGGGVGWHIKQACHNGNEGTLTFYGASIAANNLQRVLQLSLGGATVYGNMNITGQYLISGTDIKGAMQTPWISNINANNFHLDNLGLLHLNIRAPDVGWDTHTRLWAQTGWGARFDSHQFDFNVSSSSNTRMAGMSIAVGGTVTIPGRANIYALSDRAEGAGVWLDKAGAPAHVYMGLENGSNFWRLYTPAHGNMVMVDYVNNSVGIAIAPAHKLHVGGNFGVNGRALIVRPSASSDWGGAVMEIQASGAYGPRIAFHYAGLGIAQQFGIDSAGTFTCFDNPGTNYSNFRCGALFVQGAGNVAGVLYTAGIRNASSYIMTDYFHMTADNVAAAAVASRIPLETNSDGYLRWGTPSHINKWNSPHASAVPLARYLIWRYPGEPNAGVNWVIFDGANGYGPDNSTPLPSSINASYPWAQTYPVLMAWNAGSTHGVRVDSARVADTAGSISSTTSNITVNSIVIGGGFFFDQLGEYGSLRLVNNAVEMITFLSHSASIATNRRGRPAFRGPLYALRYGDSAQARAAGLIDGDVYVNHLNYVICLAPS